MNCSGTNENLDPSLQSFSIIVYVTLFLFGILFNVFALWIFCCRLPKWTETSVFLVNLMVADILIVFTFPFRIYSLLSSWHLSIGLCNTVRATYFVNKYMSIFIITAIALDRYLGVCHPIKYKGRMTALKAFITCCFFWTLFIIISILRTILRKNDTLISCFRKVTSEPNNMILVYSVAGFFLPVVLVIFCSVKVIKTLSVKEPFHSKRLLDFRRAKNILISNLIIFVVCFLPVHVGYIVRFVAEGTNSSCHTTDMIQVFIHLATIVSSTNCILDSVCYYFAASEFHNAVSKLTFLQHRFLCMS